MSITGSVTVQNQALDELIIVPDEKGVRLQINDKDGDLTEVVLTRAEWGIVTAAVSQAFQVSYPYAIPAPPF